MRKILVLLISFLLLIGCNVPTNAISIDILMDSDKTVTAHFNKIEYSLSATSEPDEGGAVNGAGIYDAETSVDINAIPNSGYQFSSWSGDLSGNTNPTTIIIDSNKVIVAHFIKIQYTLITMVEPASSGTITGAGTYNEGTVITVEAIPAEDYEFDHWEGIGKWSGLGMGLYWAQDSYVETILSNGFKELRIDIPSYENTEWLGYSKTAVISAVGKGADVIWGVSFGETLTAANWAAYVTAVTSAATWAQANGVFEFQLGNELEGMVDGTTLTVAQLITNLKALATDVKEIFTNGNVSYSAYQLYIDDWVTAGKGDIDILPSNVYMTWGVDKNPVLWKDYIDALVGAFGTEGTYLTEFTINTKGLEYYSEDEAVQAVAVAEMIEYIKASGMTRAIWYCWKDDTWSEVYQGVVKADESYRQLWDSLINSN